MKELKITLPKFALSSVEHREMIIFEISLKKDLRNWFDNIRYSISEIKQLIRFEIYVAFRSYN